ncbi:hypothetical protein NL676_025530 [Syzygium grande]|nr:hypothetical protein NL676_025530 [Syzygium grande]
MYRRRYGITKAQILVTFVQTALRTPLSRNLGSEHADTQKEDSGEVYLSSFFFRGNNDRTRKITAGPSNRCVGGGIVQKAKSSVPKSKRNRADSRVFCFVLEFIERDDFLLLEQNPTSTAMAPSLHQSKLEYDQMTRKVVKRSLQTEIHHGYQMASMPWRFII